METDEKVYKFMLEYQGDILKPPKMDEIRDAIEGLNYRSSVRQSLMRLKERGLVEYETPNKMRCWRAVDG